MARIVNIAHTAFYMLAAYCFYTLLTRTGLGFLLSGLISVGAVITWDKRHDIVWAVGKTSGIAVQWQDGKKVAFWPPQVKGMQPFKLPTR